MANRASVTIDINANTSKLFDELTKVQGALKAIGNTNIGRSLNSELDKLGDKVANLQSKASNELFSKKDYDAVVKDFKAVNSEIDVFLRKYANVQNLTNDEKLQLYDPKAVDTLKRANEAIGDYTKKMTGLAKAHTEVKDAQTASRKAQTELNKAQKEATTKELSWKEAKKSAEDYSKKLETVRKAYTALKNAQSNFEQNNSKANQNALNKANQNFNEGLGALNSLLPDRDKANSIKAFENKQDRYDILKSELTSDIQAAEQEYNRIIEAVNNYQKALEDAKIAEEAVTKAAETKDLEELKRVLNDLGIPTENIKDLETARNALNEFEQLRLSNAQEQIDTVTNSINNLKTEMVEVGKTIKNEASAIDQLDLGQSQNDQLARRLEQYTSLAFTIRTVTNVLKESYNTIKDLDAAMAETAVVTQYSIDDMWKTLNAYTEQANSLGVAIKDVYASSTLYYQQGLKSSEVAQLTNSTLKMARIAGLDAAEATDRMTNALRGFNMALNETNAQNVADVYSKLAAITASDVDEISTAMTKVASLANSANMSFENTAAFLSQIIETTRESAETAGTALKTVVARFAEVKNAPTTSVDVEGEAASYNKIDTALRSVGISLDAFMKGQEGLDQVLMKLAAKWDSLSTTTQRYIATQAAGSRQQSRFIALMSDYARTQELVTAANNAAGASAEQYAKTLDSLETKLNQLQNAWDTFTTTLLDQKAIKIVIDLLTGLINGLNNLNETLDNQSSGIGFVARLAEGAIILNTFQNVVGGIANGFHNAGKEGSSFFAGMMTGMNRNGIVLRGFSDVVKEVGFDLKTSADVGALFELGLEGIKTRALTLGKTLITFLPLILKIAGAIALVATAIHLIYKASLKGRLEEATTMLSGLSEAADMASDALTNLQDTFTRFSDAQDTISTLQKGTAEWTKQVVELNSEVQDLASSYGLLNEVRYTNDGVAYLTADAQAKITEAARRTAVAQMAAENSAQARVNDLQSQMDAKTTYRGLTDKGGYTQAEFKSLINDIVKNNGILDKKLLKQATETYGETSLEIQQSAQELASDIIANRAAQNANTEALLNLNSTILNGDNETLPSSDYIDQYSAGIYNQFISDTVKDLLNKATSAGTVGENGAYQGSGYDIDYIKGLIKELYPNAVATSFNIFTGNVKYKNQGDKEYTSMTLNDFLNAYATSKYTQEQARDAIYKGAAQEKSLRNSLGISTTTASASAGVDALVGAIANIQFGNASTLGTLNLNQAIYDAIKTANLSDLGLDLEEIGWNKILNTGEIASAIVDGMLNVDPTISNDMANTIWSTIYQALYNTDGNIISAQYDFSNLTYAALDAIIRNASTPDAIREAATKAQQTLSDNNKNANANFSTEVYADDYLAAQEEEISGQSDYFLDAAKSIANYTGALRDSNGELKEGAERVYIYGTRLEKCALYGEKFAKAVSNYKDAIESGNITEQSAAFSEIATYLYQISGIQLTTSDLLELDPKLIQNSTNSLADFGKLLDALQIKAYRANTVLDAETTEALVALGSGYTKTAGTIIDSDNKVIQSFNNMIHKSENVETTLATIKSIIGSGWQLDIEYDADGLAYISKLIATSTDAYGDLIKYSQSDSKWTNTLTHHYQLLQDINKEQRALNKLQHEYELSTKAASGYQGDIADILKQQAKNYQTQYDSQTKAKNSYLSDLQQLNNKYAKTNYGQYMTYDFTAGKLVVNESLWQKKNNTTDGTFTQTLDEIKKQYEEAIKGLENAEDTLIEIENDVADLRNEAYESYWGLVQETIDMLVEKEQKSIDLQEAQLSATEEANNQLISSIRDNFSQLRQDRANEKTESDINNLAKKLAYLKQDTTGGNLTQIRELEKQLADQKESYTDTLIDQGLDAMEQSYEATAEYQRKMLDYQQSQLDYSKENNLFEKKARELLESIESGVKLEESDWYSLYSEMNKNMNTGDLYLRTNEIKTKLFTIDTWMKELLDADTKASDADNIGTKLTTNNVGTDNVSLNLGSNTTKNPTGPSSTDIKTVQAWMNKYAGAKIQETGSWDSASKTATINMLGKDLTTGSYTDAKATMDNYTKVTELERWLKKQFPSQTANLEVNGIWSSEDVGLAKTLYGDGSFDVLYKKMQTTLAQTAQQEQALLERTNAQSAVQEYLDGGFSKIQSDYNTAEQNYKSAKAQYESELQQTEQYGTGISLWTLNRFTKAEKAYQDILPIYNTAKKKYDELLAVYEAAQKKYAVLMQRTYKTGGLADFTGPAWLDGTKSNPELVLNAKDTENFIQLKDILRSLFNGGTTTNNSVGDSYFDIDVNVDKIDSQYDISQIAEDIKYSIYKDASYRNVNTISTLK